MLDTDPADANLSELRQQAMDRATVLLRQLEADHADLLQRKGRCKTLSADSGIEAVASAIEKARRVRSQLQGE
jgi:hypothetical protein